MTEEQTQTKIPTALLDEAMTGSWYTIAGCGGDLNAWTAGYEELMAKEGIGKPIAWYWTTGAAINEFAGSVKNPDQRFGPDLTVLLFPLDGLNVGKLAMFKLAMQDRWFDDIVENMRGW